MPRPGCPVYQRGEQQRADPALLPAVSHHNADIATTGLVGGHAVTNDRAEAVSDKQDVRRSGCPAQRPHQAGARRRYRRKEAEVLAARRQAADKLADPVGIGFERCPKQAGLARPGFDS